MEEVKDITIMVKWCGKEFIISDLIDNDTVAVLRHEMQVKILRLFLSRRNYKYIREK